MSSGTPHEIKRVGGDAPPSWLAEYAADDESTKDLQEYKVLGRLKIVQGLSDDALKEIVGEGGVVLVPANQAICTRDDGFEFVPVFFFVEYITWNDRKDRSGNQIRDKSFDSTSEIAIKSRDPDKWEEAYGDLNMLHCEHLNFAGFISNDLGEPQACVLSYVRGEFTKGKHFITAIAMRKVDGKPVPLWAQRWRFQPAKRDRNGNQWWGLDHSAAEKPYIAQDEVEFYRAAHAELKEFFTTSKLRIDRDDENESETPNETPEM